MPELVLKRNRFKHFLLLLISLGFTVGGYYEVIQVNNSMTDKVMGWSLLILFGLGCPIFIMQLVRSNVGIKVSHEGFYFQGYSSQTIPWAALQPFVLKTVSAIGINFDYLHFRIAKGYENVVQPNSLVKMRFKMKPEEIYIGFPIVLQDLEGKIFKRNEVQQSDENKKLLAQLCEAIAHYKPIEDLRD